MKKKPLTTFKRRSLLRAQKSFMRRYQSLFQEQPALQVFAENLWNGWILCHQFYVDDEHCVADLPVSLVIGPAESGKTSLLNISKQILADSAELNANTPSRLLAGHPMPQYYANKKELYIEFPHYLWLEKAYLEVLLNFWNAVNYFSKINAILFVAATSQLVASKEDTLVFHSIFWASLSLLASYLKNHKVTFTYIITEIDRLQGFSEFFGDLSLEERQHAFGLTFQPEEDWFVNLRPKFNILKSRLRNRMWWRCQSEHIQRRRLLVAEFPEQFQQLQLPVMRLCRYFRELRKIQANLVIKGIFFVSNFQQGNLIDLLMQQFHFKVSKVAETLPLIPQRRHYFIKGLFQQLQFKSIVPYRPAKPRKNWHWSALFKKIINVLVILFIMAIVLAGATFEWMQWHIKQDLETNKVMANKLFLTPYTEEGAKAFVDYELPYFPLAVKQAVTKSDWLKKIIDTAGFKAINQAWQHDIYNFYLQHIANRYPLQLTAQQSITADDFDAFFGPSGKLIAFYQHYLSNNRMQSILQQQPAVLKLFSQVVMLKKLLYQDNHHLAITVSLYPADMAKTISAVNMELMGNNFTIRPGVLTANTLNWPSQQLAAESGYALIYKVGMPHTVQFKGDWSWLQLLQSFTWQKQEDDQGWLLTSADQSFNLTMNTNVDLTHLLQLLPQMTIPAQLF